MKKQQLKLAAAVFAASWALLPCASQASGIPTLDAAAISQAVTQFEQLVKEYQMLQQQYETLQQQYNQLKTITNKLSGISSIDELLRFDWEQLSMFPEFYDNVWDYSTTVMESGAQQIYNLRNFAAKCEGIDDTLKENCEQISAYTASAEYQFVTAQKKLKERMGTINSLIDEIGECETAKEIADLTARINSEAAYLQLADMQVEISRKTLEAAIDGARRTHAALVGKAFTVNSGHDFSNAFK